MNTNEQPTKEQIKKLWIWSGLKLISQGKFWKEHWEMPDKSKLFDAPEIDLNNLRKYTIPVLQDKGYQIRIVCYEQKEFMVSIFDIVRSIAYEPVDSDSLELALFWAIWNIAGVN
ncbi:hypothetical protein M0R04_08405 [Candidatus Dojkabacteria bacterium]|jgi:hypothetical protein|nr:hypothetical protein [Candidatus Dojkabacteria bacterium]